jgi:hypothetical protein
MKPDPKSDAGAALRALEALGDTADAEQVARRIGWVKRHTYMALADASAEEWVEVKLGPATYDTERAETAILALVEMGAIAG